MLFEEDVLIKFDVLGRKLILARDMKEQEVDECVYRNSHILPTLDSLLIPSLPAPSTYVNFHTA